MIVIDSSALVAILLEEPQAGRLEARIGGEPRAERLVSCANWVEAGAVIAARSRSPETGLAALETLGRLLGLALAPVDADQARLALAARVRFGRGFGGPGGLNFGDCFAYALAKLRAAPLLFIGVDFAATDIVPALAPSG